MRHDNIQEVVLFSVVRNRKKTTYPELLKLTPFSFTQLRSAVFNLLKRRLILRHGGKYKPKFSLNRLETHRTKKILGNEWNPSWESSWEEIWGKPFYG